MIPLDRVDAFIAFAEKRSFTHAAKELHLSQPALFAQIQKLEEQLGVSVYRRRGRSLELTEEGERVLGFAREIRQRVHGFEASLRGERVDDPVVLAAGRGSYLYLLGPAVKRFRRSPWTLAASVVGRDRCLEDVRLGRAHIGVAAGVVDLPDELIGHPLRQVGSAVAFPSGHRFTSRRRLRVADLDGESLVAPPRGRAQRATVDAALREAGCRCSVVAEADGWDLLLHFVSLGLGLAIVNDCCHLPRGVKARPLTGVAGTSYVVLHRRAIIHPGARALLEAIRSGA